MSDPYDFTTFGIRNMHKRNGFNGIENEKIKAKASATAIVLSFLRCAYGVCRVFLYISVEGK